MERITQLTTKEILDKEFKTSLRGYNQEEVDKFLDIIIKDYEALQKRCEQIEQENQRLRKEADKRQTEQKRQAYPTNQNTNYDILKRLSNLEKHVFGNKLFD